MEDCCVDKIADDIDKVIAARKKLLPDLREEHSRVSDQIEKLQALNAQLDRLRSHSKDEIICDEIAAVKDDIANSATELIMYQGELDELKSEFNRDTLNIGVSGAARTGKSTTLQGITGLTSNQIPSGDLNPVTAVRSEIYNSSRNEAVVLFKTERDFIDGYICPHVSNVNKYLDTNSALSIGSLSSLREARFPDRLDGRVDAAATDSLKRLKEAQRSIDSFKDSLGAKEKTIQLDDVRRYVTYPDKEAEQKEVDGKFAADRIYLSVDLVKIYCKFPNLGDARIGLVDLPGLGEIGNSASDMHLKGLEDKVDQIFLVMKPSKEKAFVDNEVGYNLNQLQRIQPAVSRGDLIVAGVNEDAAVGQAAAENLLRHFDSEINAGRADRYSTIRYCAVNVDSVARMFDQLLDRLRRRLPKMDQQKVKACMDSANLRGRVAEIAGKVVHSMDQVLCTIPSTDLVTKRRIDAIERSVIGGLNDYAFELSEQASSKSDVFNTFVADAQRIHDDVAAHVENGLFRENDEEWLELTRSSKDYYNLYRDECKRIRYEIIDAYCGLDRFYGEYVSNFKLRVLNTFLCSCGLDGFPRFAAVDDVDEHISEVANELGSKLGDTDFDRAMDLLKGVRFDFRSNVFLQIEGHLAKLANPGECFDTYTEEWKNKRKFLGGNASNGSKQKALAEYLRKDAETANDGILKTLKSEQDRFNAYLAVSIDFFNNYLFGKDEDNFKQVVIRGLIREYKQWVFPDADDVSKSPLGRVAKEVKESALELEEDAFDRGSACGSAFSAASNSSELRVSGKRVQDVTSFEKGEILKAREVTKVEDDCAFVSLPNNNYGKVRIHEVHAGKVDNIHDYVKKGDQVDVMIIASRTTKEGKRWYLLSMKQCK